MFLPLWDENPFEKPRLPLLSWGIIAINLAVYAYSSALPEADLPAFLALYGVVPAQITHLDGGILASARSLFSAMFLHASAVHILGNMVFLWVFSDDIEETLGPVRFLAFYLLCGLLSGLAYAVTDPNSVLPEVGASGAISGVLAAYLMLRPCRKVATLIGWFVIRLDAYWLIGLWVVFQLIDIAAAADDSVAYAAHFGGLLAGAALFPLLRPAGVELFQCFDRA